MWYKKYKKHRRQAGSFGTFLTLLCTGWGGHPLGFWSLEPSRVIRGTQMLTQFIHDAENWFYEKKIQIFFNFFHFFQFFGHPSCTKRFFSTFGQKITCFYVFGGQHVHLTPKKCFLEAFLQSVLETAVPCHLGARTR